MLLRKATAPLAEEPRFREMVEGTGHWLILAFVVAAARTLVEQSSGAVSVLGISLATVGIVSVDQAIMTIYGSHTGSGAILAVLPANLTGRSRQVVMCMAILNALICAVVIPLLYAEIHFGVPSIEAAIDGTGFDLPQRLALVYVVAAVVPVPIMLAVLGPSTRILEKLCPKPEIDELSRAQFIHGHATVDIETSLMLADLERKCAFRMQLRYFELLREGKDVRPLRDTSRTLMTEIEEFLTELQPLHPMQAVEDRNALLNRQKPLTWPADSVAVMCDALLDVGDRPELKQFPESMCEGVDSVFLALDHAMEGDDETSWDIASALSGGRGEIMRGLGGKYMEADLKLEKSDLLNVVLATDTAEEIFFLLSKLEEDFNPYPHRDGALPRV